LIEFARGLRRLIDVDEFLLIGIVGATAEDALELMDAPLAIGEKSQKQMLNGE